MVLYFTPSYFSFMSSSFFCSSSQPSHSSLSQSSRGLQLPHLISHSVLGQPRGSRKWVRTHRAVCVCCQSSAFHVFIFHHCKWSVPDNAGCNYELLSIFRHTQLHSGESLGDVIISVMAQRCHPLPPPPPCSPVFTIITIYWKYLPCCLLVDAAPESLQHRLLLICS